MTSASELFHSRRSSRVGRNSPDHLPLGPFDPISQYRHRFRHHRHRPVANNHPISGSNINNTRRDRVIHPSSLFPNLERESVRSEQGSNHSASINGNVTENDSNLQSRRRYTGNERLPGAVLLARERLLQRLRGFSLSENRQSNRVSSTNGRIDFTIDDDYMLTDAGDWDTEFAAAWLAATSASTYSPRQEKSKRPSGLGQEALNSLHIEFFSNSDKDDHVGVSSPMRDCSICLEGFAEGDRLKCLPCGHRFHCCCLDPWLQICGDCPYCRAGILTTTCRDKE